MPVVSIRVNKVEGDDVWVEQEVKNIRKDKNREILIEYSLLILFSPGSNSTMSFFIG